VDELLKTFVDEFPPTAVYRNEVDAAAWLAGSDDSGYANRTAALEELMLLHIANENPAFEPFLILFDDEKLEKLTKYEQAWGVLKDFFVGLPEFGPDNQDLVSMLMAPIVFSPHSLKGQLDYIRTRWGVLLGEWLLRLLAGVDMIQEEEKPGWSGHFSGPPPMEAYSYDSMMKEYERFSPDRDWMPQVVLMAKTVLVWLNQLTDKYGYEITRLDQIPDEELDILAQEGFTGLWLIGLWERSWGSKRIKQINGNPDAAASAYSLHDYEIAEGLGGWGSLDNLRRRLWYRGIRLASDMVPNHTGMDAKWVVEKPDLFIQSRESPFPGYDFNGENLSLDPRISVFLENRYYSKSDCAVVFKRVDNQSGDTRYIYHGNDGTGMPWNDTAQIDFLNPQAREEVIQKILHVARNFPIIRFDAAMVLAKKHIERLWYPQPGQGGDIASRAEYAMSQEEFNRRIPEEFWREVVDRCAQEVPDTLLLAEAFWMMEGYFVRTLGMHRVYNSAFMNMLKREENFKYRATVKNTLEFDPQVLKRFVNFMNNPDEETAVMQFGRGDKYFGVCTLMITMPGLPMFGHGQIEGFEEKYGMEFTKANWKEVPDEGLIERHRRDIFPLMKKRYLFADSTNFLFYDLWNNGSVNENVFAYSNRVNDEKAIVFYNNAYDQASGWIKTSCPYLVKTGEDSKVMMRKTLSESMNLSTEDNRFLIFQEQKSGLWFIRNSKEVCEKGLFVILNGYEYQVLLNIHEVTDNDEGHYRMLFEQLAGKGVPNILFALQEIFLKELYRSLMAFASPEFFRDTAILMGTEVKVPEVKSVAGKNAAAKSDKGGKKKEPKVKDVLDRVEKSARVYFETLAAFIAGNYGSSEAFDPKTVGPEVPVEEAWNRFTLRYQRLMKIREIAENPGDAIPAKTAETVAGIYRNIASQPYMAEMLAGYSILCSVRDVIGDRATGQDTKELINLWCLDRKVRDAMTEYGVPSKDGFYVFRTMLELMPFADIPLAGKDRQLTAWTLVQKLVESDAGRSLLGLNMYENILWFNSEKTDEALRQLECIYAVQGEPPELPGDAEEVMVGEKAAAAVTVQKKKFSLPAWNKEMASLAEVWEFVLKARDGSEYQAERFVEGLKPVVVEGKKGRKEKV
jgi:glycosidase